MLEEPLKNPVDPGSRMSIRTTVRKSLLALRGVGPESEAESVRFHGRRVTKVGPEVKHGLFRVAGRARNPCCLNEKRHQGLK